jgi:hypothetical protein
VDQSLNISRLLIIASLIVLSLFALYAALIIYLIWPISEFSISKAGTFGDSFGALTSLFTGLGFVGLLATIFLQREELKLNRQELEETRKEIQLQSQTFYRQRFEDAFYAVLALYKENLKELSIRVHSEDYHRLYGVEALRYLIKNFEKVWGKENIHKFPETEDEMNEYIFILSSKIQSVFIRQTRYVDTISGILMLIDEECEDSNRKKMYWRILISQLTAYEIKYLFYQALITKDYISIRELISNSEIFKDRLAILNIPASHRKAFEFAWGIPLPKKRNPIPSILSNKQITAIRRKQRLAKKTYKKDNEAKV